MSAGEELEQAPPDGLYAVITYGDDPFTHPVLLAVGAVPMMFPWGIRLYAFKNGLCDDMGYSSSPSRTLEERDVRVVYLVELVPQTLEDGGVTARAGT